MVIVTFLFFSLYCFVEYKDRGDGDTNRLGHGMEIKFRHRDTPTKIPGLCGKGIQKLSLARGNEGALTGMPLLFVLLLFLMGWLNDCFRFWGSLFMGRYKFWRPSLVCFQVICVMY